MPSLLSAETCKYMSKPDKYFFCVCDVYKLRLNLFSLIFINNYFSFFYRPATNGDNASAQDHRNDENVACMQQPKNARKANTTQ